MLQINAHLFSMLSMPAPDDVEVLVVIHVASLQPVCETWYLLTLEYSVATVKHRASLRESK